MDRFIINLFGYTRTNLLGWIVAGLLVMGLSLCLFYLAYQPPLRPGFSPEWYLLAAIALLLLGIFGVLLQMYCAQVAEKLERDARAREVKALDDED
jgi:hypothetical protein